MNWDTISVGERAGALYPTWTSHWMFPAPGRGLWLSAAKAIPVEADRAFCWQYTNLGEEVPFFLKRNLEGGASVSNHSHNNGNRHFPGLGLC